MESKTTDSILYHLLFIDDDLDFLKSMDMAISQKLFAMNNGVEIESHFLSDPNEGLAFMQELIDGQEIIAVVISDQQMPELSGIDFLEKANKIVPKAIKMLLTGYASVESAKYAINHQILDQYISKPIEDHDYFAYLIKNAIKTFHFREEKEQAQEALLKARDELERKVKERTAELVMTKEQLEMELKERKRAQEVYHSLIHTSADSIIIYDMDGKVKYINPSFTGVFGWTLEEVQGKKIPFLPEGERESTMSRVKDIIVRGRAIQGFETKRYTKDGSIINVDVSGSRYNNHEGAPAGMLVILRDTTEKKRLEIQLQSTQKLEAIGTLAGGIAHDFNNILQAIIMNTELALFEYKHGTFDAIRLEESLKASERAKDLVNQILTFSRRSEQELEPLQISLIAKEAIKMLRASLPSTIEIKQNIEAKSDFIMGDPTQIHQVMVNCCTNAAHAMKEKGGILEVSLKEVDLNPETVAPYPGLKQGNFVKLTVSDTGHGMTSDVIEKIFDPFFTTKERGEGTGLGLAVVHGIVKSLGGFIIVDSEPKKGTSFEIFFPTKKRKVKSRNDLREPIPRGNEKILVVDDEFIIMDLLSGVLGNLGYEIESRNSSTDALKDFRSQPDKFDLVITDQTMPHMTGADLAKEIMRIRPDIPVILCTGYSEIISEEKAKSIGIREFIMKPIESRILANTVRRILDEKGQQRLTGWQYQ